MRTKSENTLFLLCEGAILTALAWALSLFDIPLGYQGGSVDFVMVPLLLFSLRHGPWWGLLQGLAFGTLKFFLAGGFAITWESILLDYTLAYAAVGVAGFFYRSSKKNGALLGVTVGGLVRYFVHFLSGVTIYAEYMLEEFWGMKMTSTFVYSILYNGAYMVPNIVLALIVTPLLLKALNKARL